MSNVTDGFDVVIKHAKFRKIIDEMTDEHLESALKLQKLVKKEIENCWIDRVKFSKEKNKDMLYYTNDKITTLQNLQKQSQKTVKEEGDAK